MSTQRRSSIKSGTTEVAQDSNTWLDYGDKVEEPTGLFTVLPPIEVSSNCVPANYLSEYELAILRSVVPITTDETEEITALGNRGIWINRQEIASWPGNLKEYILNEDPNPEVIIKKMEVELEYVQELAVRYLRPPVPTPPGDILITQEVGILAPPAPPLVIRQQPPRPSTPEPLVVREVPPPMPAPIGQKIITISGKRLPPPPRKVIVERLPPVPSKPQSVITERWLPYAQVKRRVLFKAAPPDPVYCKPRNIIVQWEAPTVRVKQEIKYLGTVNADPEEYVRRYGDTLRVASELPEIVRNIPVQEGVVLAADYSYNPVPELEGDIQALGLIDLEREGLEAYRKYTGITTSSTTSSQSDSASIGLSSSSLGASRFLTSQNVLSAGSQTFEGQQILD